jgi:hypothetical protein
LEGEKKYTYVDLSLFVVEIRERASVRERKNNLYKIQTVWCPN